MGKVLAFLFLTSVALSAFVARAVADADKTAEIARHRTWLALHYYSELDGGRWESEIRDDEKAKNFFLSRAGREAPEAELAAFLAALREPAPEDAEADVRCRFPARFAFVAGEFPGAVPRAARVCPRFEKWRAQIDADSAQLLFAAAFFNSPASMYGHTLLQLGRKGMTKGEALLDYVVAFGAESGDASGVTYLFHGLTGGFPGFFSTVPFYLKIREYNDAESRDIWAYKLRLAPEQLDFLVRHLWEVRNANFPYYFLGKNCSYFLLRFLEVVNSGPPLLGDLPGWTIPVDTIRMLARRGWIAETAHRPSRSARMLARRARLDGAERDMATSLARGDDPSAREKVKALAVGNAARVLDAAYEYTRFLQGGRPPTPEEFARERWLLAERAANPVPPEPLTFAREAPEDSHLSNRIGLAAGVSDMGGDGRDRGGFELLEWRPALHDLLDNPHGLDHYGEQEILNSKLRIDNRRSEILLESVDLVRIRALHPLDPWFLRPSWRFRLGAARALDVNCAGWRCTFARLEIGAGASKALRHGTENFAFGIVGVDIHAGAPFAPDYRIGVGPELGLKLHPWGPWRILAEASWKRYFLGDDGWIESFALGQSFALGRRWELRLTGGMYEKNREATAGVYHFY